MIFLLIRHRYYLFADLELCIDLYNRRGGLDENIKICKNNKKILDNWEKKSDFLRHFSLKKNQSVTPSYFVYKKKCNHKNILNFLSSKKIAFDIKLSDNEGGIRIWNGPNIKKNDLIALTNWLDWCFNEFE